MSRPTYQPTIAVLLLSLAALGAGLLFQACSAGTSEPRTEPAAAQASAPSEVSGGAGAGVVEDGPLSDTIQNDTQLALLMAYAADLASTSPAGVQCLLDQYKPSSRDWWKVVWGPVTVNKPPPPHCPPPRGGWPADVPANTMFVAKKGVNEYFVGIAGTDQKSGFDWCVEDFDVTWADWTHGSAPSSAQVAQGTLDGLEILLDEMRDPNQQQGLVEFFAAAGNDPIQVSVAGHSLGGALAPVMALWLVDYSWDQARLSKVSAYAFAGATPGNQDFATYLNGRFPGDQLVVLNNTKDVVPLAWNKTTMERIPDVYTEQGITPEGDLKVLLEGLIPLSKPEYTRLGGPGQQQTVTGTVYSVKELAGDSGKQQPPKCLLWLPCYLKQENPLCKKPPFTQEAIYQHVCVYPEKVGPTGLFSNIVGCSSS